MESRVKRLFEMTEHEKPDIMVFANATDPMLDKTFFYATGLGNSGVFEGSYVFCHPDGRVEMVTSILEEESARKGDFPVHIFKTQDERKEYINGCLEGVKTIGINAKELVHSQYMLLKELAPHVEFIDISKAVRDARVVKDEKEIETTRVACTIASQAAEEIITFIKPGIKESDIAAELVYIMQKKGANGPSFDSIVAFQENSAEPHYRAGDRVLKEGEFVLMDFGALYNRYVSDITRTYFMGQPNAEQKKIYETVLDAQLSSLDMIKDGVKGADVHNVASEIINATEFKGRFTHGLGHSIGLSVHDGSGLSPAVDITLREGMLFTVEPGIYIPGFGGVRIEDDVLVKKDGVEILTTASKELIII